MGEWTGEAWQATQTPYLFQEQMMGPVHQCQMICTLVHFPSAVELQPLEAPVICASIHVP